MLWDHTDDTIKLNYWTFCLFLFLFRVYLALNYVKSLVLAVLAVSATKCLLSQTLVSTSDGTFIYGCAETCPKLSFIFTLQHMIYLELLFQNCSFDSSNH